MKLEIIKKHILIDARLYGPTHTGIGRYVQNLLFQLIHQPSFSSYKWTLLVYPQLLEVIKKDLGSNFSYVPINIRHYSLAEQILLPITVYRLHPTLFHVPHFNKPILYFGKTIVTIHDLIKHFSKGQDTTTKAPLLYWPKYFAYLLLTRLVINYNPLIVPSNFWRDYIIKNFSKSPDKIITTYEAVDPKFLIHKPARLNGSTFGGSYLLYTGNLYPHKNIIVVLKALQQLPKIKLKIISKPNIFQERTQKLVRLMNLQNQVEFLGFVPDAEFAKLHYSALAYIFPSLMEGFGLPGLEAQALGCPVISSNTSCLPEIYDNSVLYFDPQNDKELIKNLKLLQSNPTLRQDLIKRGFAQVKKYDWKNTAKLTIQFYEKNIRT